MGKYDCIDCGSNTRGIDEYYMIQFDLWKEFVPENNSDTMLCLGCLEKRLGRELTPEDFLDCPLNNDEDYDKSNRFLSRLGRITNAEAEMFFWCS